MKHEFRHRFTDAILHTEEVSDDAPNVLRLALEQAAIRGRSADALRDMRDDTESKLEDEDIDDAERKLLQRRIEAIDRDLASPSARAYLARANLDGANLDGANLAGAYLARAYLARAYLAGAYLARAYLGNARNLPAGIAAVDPPEPYQLPPQTVAAQAERARLYREAHPDVPVVERLDARILEAVTTGGGTLYMRDWHRDGECGTTHIQRCAAEQVAAAGSAAGEPKVDQTP